jgi:hypothetical protein
MPNLGKCKTVGGRLCCWDRDKKSFFYVDLTPVTGKTELSNVIAAFMEDGDSRKTGKAKRNGEALPGDSA